MLSVPNSDNAPPEARTTSPASTTPLTLQPTVTPDTASSGVKRQLFRSPADDTIASGQPPSAADADIVVVHHTTSAPTQTGGSGAVPGHGASAKDPLLNKLSTDLESGKGRCASWWHRRTAVQKGTLILTGAGAIVVAGVEVATAAKNGDAARLYAYGQWLLEKINAAALTGETLNGIAHGAVDTLIVGIGAAAGAITGAIKGKACPAPTPTLRT